MMINLSDKIKIVAMETITIEFKMENSDCTIKQFSENLLHLKLCNFVYDLSIGVSVLPTTDVYG